MKDADRLPHWISRGFLAVPAEQVITSHLPPVCSQLQRFNRNSCATDPD